MTRRRTRRGADDTYLAARWAPPEPIPLDPRAVQLCNADTLARQPISVAQPNRWASAACQSRTPEQRAGRLAHGAGPRTCGIDCAVTEADGLRMSTPERHTRASPRSCACGRATVRRAKAFHDGGAAMRCAKSPRPTAACQPRNEGTLRHAPPEGGGNPPLDGGGNPPLSLAATNNQ